MSGWAHDPVGERVYGLFLLCRTNTVLEYGLHVLDAALRVEYSVGKVGGATIINY